MCQKGYGFSSSCARESVECQKLVKIGRIIGATGQQLYQLTTFPQYLCHKGYPFLRICDRVGMDFSPNFVPVGVGFRNSCASEDRGFAGFPGDHPPPGATSQL